MEDHNIGFVIAAYFVGLGATIGIIALTWLDYRQLKQALAKFPSRASEGEPDVRG
jgi:hypothetical protein